MKIEKEKSIAGSRDALKTGEISLFSKGTRLFVGLRDGTSLCFYDGKLLNTYGGGLIGRCRIYRIMDKQNE